MDNIKSQGVTNVQDMDLGEIVVSSIRPGMKREFAMMMKTQLELGGLTSGRRRVTRSLYASGGNSSKGSVPSHGKSNKKVRQLGSNEVEKNEEETLDAEDNGKLKDDAISEMSTFADGLGEVSAEDRSELEKVRDDSKGGAAQPLCAEDLLPQAGDSDKEVIQGSDSIIGGELSHDSGSAGTSTTTPLKLEMKMSKKVELKRTPARLKDLLETGLLEGLHVCYRGSKGKKRKGSVLHGIIQGTGILCACDECKGSTVVTPNQFELHAGSGNKRPPEYIMLDNGNSLRDVLNACKADSLDSLESVIRSAIGRSDHTNAFCVNCKELIPKAGTGRPMLLCDSCIQSKDPDSGHTQITQTTLRSPLADVSSSIPSGSQPALQESDETSSGTQPQIKRQGKITRKDLRMHKSVFAENVLPGGTVLAYVLHGKIRLKGYKRDTGILCTCCEEVISPSLFENHAGFSSRRKPYMSIYTSNGVSLHQLSVALSKHRTADPDESDDLCFTCQDGGELLCCDNCPRAFHIECVGLSCVPEGKWYCKYCRNMFEKEKNAERDANAIAAGRVPGVDPIAEIHQRCIRVIETPTPEPDTEGCCTICRGNDFTKSKFDGHTVMICDQCEKEYHVRCLKEHNMDDLKELPEHEWFCTKACNNMYSALQKLVDSGEQRLPETILNNLKGKIEAQDSQQNPELDVKWRLLIGKKSSEETRAWLSGAVNIFQDCFDPITDSSPKKRDLIPGMVYGRTSQLHDFSGMYTAVLMVDSVVVTAGVFRVFGEEVAELPLVATNPKLQGKGYFQALYACIEDVLSSLNVKVLVLPAAHDAETMWKNKFGFTELPKHEWKRYNRGNKLMFFQGTTILHRPVPVSPNPVVPRVVDES
ncbi:uncharacterized protein LOC127259898 [Andrographis paniculata]|uniref:uncharacterized protein LOC127259898 n=1 Tax=Andrographis paniculata TaxID=175694 RepID=UPI0021E8E916|nr:uncharacterized protein LOC127259898 [Andrographis paniculata]XP_051143475.1 uncharacterized protein LOC127259898 [Andrographis paniculata]XP_051143476.1 uncharacterized protein LOC127259898 [Andrographis paniculata]